MLIRLTVRKKMFQSSLQSQNSNAEQTVERLIGPQEENETRQNPHLPKNTSGCWSCNYIFKLLKHWADGKKKKNKLKRGESRCYSTVKQHSTSSHNHMHYSVTEFFPHQWTNSIDPKKNSAGGVTFYSWKHLGTIIFIKCHLCGVRHGMIQDEPGMLRQFASIVYLQTPALGDITLCEKCLLTVTVLGSADNLALLVRGTGQWLLEWVILGSVFSWSCTFSSKLNWLQAFL